MKNLIVIFSILICMSTLFAGEKKTETDSNLEQRITTGLNFYIQYLKSDRYWIRDNAVYQIVQLKSSFPEADLSKSMKQLAHVAMYDVKPMVRIHAYLAYTFLSDERLASSIDVDFDMQDPEIFFSHLEDKVHTDHWQALASDIDNNEYSAGAADEE